MTEKSKRNGKISKRHHCRVNLLKICISIEIHVENLKSIETFGTVIDKTSRK